MDYTIAYVANLDSAYMKKRWNDIDITDLKAFIGCFVFIGVFHSNHENYDELWSTEFGQPWLRAIVSLIKFKLILKCIRFDDTQTREDRKTTDNYREKYVRANRDRSVTRKASTQGRCWS